MNGNDIKYSQDFELLMPQKQKSYPIPVNEWSVLKRKINNISENANFWHTSGSILIGVAIPSFITALTGFNELIYWGAFAVTAIAGGLCFYFGVEQRNVQNEKKEDVIEYMGVIEERFRINNALFINSAMYGIDDKYIDITSSLNSHVADSKLSVKICNELAGDDPYPGKQKELKIEYTLEGLRQSTTLSEGSILNLG